MRILEKFSAMLLIAGIGTSVGWAQGFDLHNNEGVVPNVRVTGVADEAWTFGEVDGRSFASPAIARWGWWQGITRNQAIWLSDGSWLAGQVRVVDGETVSLQNDWLQIPSVSLSAVRAIVFQPPASLKGWVELEQRLQAANGASDMIWLRGKKQLIGLVRWPSGGLTLEDELRIDIRGESIQAAIVDVEAIALSPALHPPLKQESGGKVIGLEDGSLLQVSKWKVLPNKVQLSLLSLNDIVTWDGQAEFASSVRYLSSMPGGAVFLSSLEPASYRHITDSTLAWPLGRDRDLWGRPLMISHENSVGEVFHGLAMHSSSQVAYRWDRSAGKFLSEVRFAVPQPGSSTELGDADCRVLLAREGKLVEVDAFHLNRRSEKSDYHTVDVDLSNAQLLVLVVEQGTLGQYGDHVLWLDARIVRE